MLSFQNGLSDAVGREFMAEFGGIIKDSEVAFTPNEDSEGTFGPATKSVNLQRHGNGFGFTLRHFVIYPPDLVHKSNESLQASRSNGLDKPVYHAEEDGAQKTQPMDVVFIRQVAPNSPADRAGLSTGDQIISVNKDSVLGKSYIEVIQLIQECQDILELDIVPKEDCMLQLVTPSLTDMPSNRPASPPSITRLSNNWPESHNSSPRMMPSVTVTHSSPGSSTPPLRTSSVHLKLSNHGSGNSPDHRSNSSLPLASFMRNSVDRAAQENRSFVITGISNTMDTNSNLLPMKSKMNGSFFMTATDSTGRARALHFENGSATGSALSVVDDPRERSRSLTTESHGLEERYIVLSQHDKKLTSSAIRDQTLSNNFGPKEFRSHSVASSIIPPFTLSAPRTYSSGGLSTSYLSTNSDSGGRQPIASEADYADKSSTAPGDSTAAHLTRANHDRQVGLQSSTVSETLLESQPDKQVGHSKLNGDRSLSLVSAPPVLYDSPRLAKDARQSDNYSNEPPAFSSQISVFPKKPSYEEVIFSQSDSGQINIGQKPRRISYLMATEQVGGAGRTVSNQNMQFPSSHGSQRSFPVPLTSSSSNLQPIMVHVSSGMELCEDTSVASENSCPQEQQGDSEGGLQDSSVQRGDMDVHSRSMNRRTSYVIATSSPTSPRHLDSLAAMQEVNEEVFEEDKEGVPGLSEVSKEGMLFRKVAIVDGGKRSNARSWKPVNAVLKGHVLYLQKDRTNSQGESSSDEQPVSIKSCIVDIAHDYTKRKNVFRVTTFNGSEFLFQAEDHGSMMSWISAIQANNNPDEDENGVTSQSVIIRRIRNVEQETAGSTAQAPTLKVSPPTNTKIPNITGGINNLKKSLSFKNIAVHGQKDKGEGSKNHWHKAIRRKKKTETSPMVYLQGHSVGVSLESCPVGSYKFVPLIVEHCCDVVEHKGLDTVGVYRVPGNSASVTAMQEEINAKGVENINFEDEKWNDVNNMTSLLKQFLRKLPEGLLTAELYDSFIDANKKEEAAERMMAFKSLVQYLPDHNSETLKLLMMHLKHIAENCEKNKMEARNLAIVFGPTLVRTGEDTMMTLVRDMSDQCRIVESLLLHCDWLFEDSEEGEDSPPKPPPVAELPHEHMLSQNVLSTLGQAAVNFGDDGSVKANKGGMSLQFPKVAVKRKSDPTQFSSPEASMTSEVPGSGSSSPSVERAPTAHFSTSDSSRSSSPTQEKLVSRTEPKRSSDVTAVGAPVHLTLLEMMDSRPRGSASLKAYSFSLPPPPSYRPQNQKRTSPVEQISPTDGSVAAGLPSGEDENVSKPGEEPQESEVSPTTAWPKIDTLSEGTRLRLLRLNLLQRAKEKKRLQKEKELGIAQVESRSESSSGDLSPEAQRANHKLSDAEGSGSSASTSRNSSAPSSNNPSLDSLQLHGADGEGNRNYAAQSSAARNLPWTSGSCTSSPQPQQKSVLHSAEEQPRSYETCVVIPRGSGVASSQVQSYAPRPCAPAVQTRHDGSRSASFDSESTESSSEDEEEGECALSLSKTFDEKLKILLDLDYKFSSEGRRRNSIKEQEDNVSVSSEPQRRLDTEHDADTQTGANRPASEQIFAYHRPKGGFLVSDLQDATPGDDIALKKSSGDEASTSLSSLASSASRKSSLSQELHSCESGVRTDSLDPGPATSVLGPAMPKVDEKREAGVSAAQPCGHKVEETEATRREKRLVPRRSVPSAAEIKITVDRSKQRSNALNSRRSIGSVRTATPVALKEFNIKEVAMKRNTGNPRRAFSEAQMHASAAQNTNPKSPLRNATSAPASCRSRPMNMSLSSSHKYDSGGAPGGRDAGRPLPIIAKSRAVPRAGYLDSGARARLLSQKAASRELLPSKAREADQGRSKVVPTEKLEKNAQHIAELLEEMHSERHLKLSRQRSDISGDAQKAAAQRAAWRRRRRSLGDNEAVLLATRLGVSTNKVVMETHRNGGRQHLEARSSAGYRVVDSQQRPHRAANSRPWK